jgi:hypothetical protein
MQDCWENRQVYARRFPDSNRDSVVVPSSPVPHPRGATEPLRSRKIVYLLLPIRIFRRVILSYDRYVYIEDERYNGSLIFFVFVDFYANLYDESHDLLLVHVADPPMVSLGRKSECANLINNYRQGVRYGILRNSVSSLPSV